MQSDEGASRAPRVVFAAWVLYSQVRGWPVVGDPQLLLGRCLLLGSCFASSQHRSQDMSCCS